MLLRLHGDSSLFRTGDKGRPNWALTRLRQYFRHLQRVAHSLHCFPPNVNYICAIIKSRSSTLQIQVNTDRHIIGSAELRRQVEATLEDALTRFTDRITRLEVHLSDESGSQKPGNSDKRCVLEARLTGMKPIKVSADGSSHERAIYDASKILQKLLGRTLNRLDNPKGRTSYAGDSTV